MNMINQLLRVMIISYTLSQKSILKIVWNFVINLHKCIIRASRNFYGII